MPNRGQLSLPLVEAGVGVLLVFAVVSGFLLALPDQRTADVQLNADARDTLSVLAADTPRHGAATRLAEVTRSQAAFEREAPALRHRVTRILPGNVLFSLRTPYGTVGYPRPSNVAFGMASRPTPYGRVTLRVWYA